MQGWALTSCHDCSSPSGSANVVVLTGLLGRINLSPLTLPPPPPSRRRSNTANPTLAAEQLHQSQADGEEMMPPPPPAAAAATATAATANIYTSAERVHDGSATGTWERESFHFTHPSWTEPRGSVWTVVEAELIGRSLRCFVEAGQLFSEEAAGLSYWSSVCVCVDWGRG